MQPRLYLHQRGFQRESRPNIVLMKRAEASSRSLASRRQSLHMCGRMVTVVDQVLRV